MTITWPSSSYWVNSGSWWGTGRPGVLWFMESQKVGHDCCPLATPTILLGFFLTWTWGISSWLLQQSTATAPYLGQGVSPHHHPPDLESGIASLGPPAPVKPPFLGSGVAPLNCRPWPRMWGSPSQLLLRCGSLALSAAAPDLGCGVAPLSCSCAVPAWHSRPLPLTSDMG